MIVLDCDAINIGSSADGKEEKKRVWTRRKDDEKNRMLCHWHFWFFTNAPMCEAWKTGECVDKKGVMVEEWKARRKEWKKKRWKKGKGKKWFWEKSFLFLFGCVFASSFPLPPAPTTLSHHNTISHSTNHTIQHDTLVQTITCKQGHVLLLLRTMAPSNKAVMTSFSFLQLEDFYYPIAFSLTSQFFLQFAVGGKNSILQLEDFPIRGMLTVYIFPLSLSNPITA